MKGKDGTPAGRWQLKGMALRMLGCHCVSLRRQNRRAIFMTTVFLNLARVLVHCKMQLAPFETIKHMTEGLLTAHGAEGQRSIVQM